MSRDLRVRSKVTVEKDPRREADASGRFDVLIEWKAPLSVVPGDAKPVAPRRKFQRLEDLLDGFTLDSE